MSVLTRILTWPRRRWRTYGFGIHSPFAYAFVTEVLAKNGAPLPERCSGFLARPDVTATLPARCRDRRVTVIDSYLSRQPADSGTPVYIVSHIDKGANKALWKQLTGNATYGMDFSDCHTGVICRFPHLPRQSFKVVVRR